MIFDLETYTVEAIQAKDAWGLCDFMVSNSDRLKRFFPKTLEQNLNPALSQIFVAEKLQAFQDKREFLYTLKEKEHRTIIGLIYLKKLDWTKKEGELAYCLGYQFEGKGIISKTILYISNWANQEMGLETLKIITHTSNLASVAVAKNSGFTWQKTLFQEHTPPNEKPLDMELFEKNYEGKIL